MNHLKGKETNQKGFPMIKYPESRVGVIADTGAMPTT
jgi:hypothetical protein